MNTTMTCNTCTNSIYQPYRRYDERGQVLEGCVDACHTDHITPMSESARWHNRKEAKVIRKNLAKFGK